MFENSNTSVDYLAYLLSAHAHTKALLERLGEDDPMRCESSKATDNDKQEEIASEKKNRSAAPIDVQRVPWAEFEKLTGEEEEGDIEEEDPDTPEDTARSRTAPADPSLPSDAAELSGSSEGNVALDLPSASRLLVWMRNKEYAHTQQTMSPASAKPSSSPSPSSSCSSAPVASMAPFSSSASSPYPSSSSPSAAGPAQETESSVRAHVRVLPPLPFMADKKEWRRRSYSSIHIPIPQVM